MKRLTVLYDRDCGFCVYCRSWLARQPAFLGLDFAAIQSAEARALLAPYGIEETAARELLVLSDEGGLYRGAKAFIMALYALQEYREWSLFLARPSLRPLARRAFETLSRNRKRLSVFLRDRREDGLSQILEAEEERCNGGDCFPDRRRARPLAR